MIGSFLNALIYRLPREINIAIPRSSCPHCKKIICWYENIPILSYLFLRGKCSSCGKGISIRYPVIELLVGCVAVMKMPTYFSSMDLMYFFFFFSTFCAFFVHFLIDLEHKILPDSINLYLLFTFLLFSLLNNGWQFALLGGAVGFGTTYLVTWGFYLLRGKVGLGGGDIKLFGVLGVYLGPLSIIHNIFLSCFLGALVGGSLMLLKKVKRETQIPFGPFIISVGVFQIFFPELYGSFISFIM